MNQSDYRDKRDRIVEAMKGVIVIPKGRSGIRYWHGKDMSANADKSRYIIGYTYQRTYSNPMTGNVYDVTLGVGTDFESALANAVKRETAKRARLVAREQNS